MFLSFCNEERFLEFLKRIIFKVFLIALEFPYECYNFDTPFSLRCYASVWNSSGCLKQGKNSPGRLESNEIRILNSLNLR